MLRKGGEAGEAQTDSMGGCLEQTSSSVRARQRVRAYGCIPDAVPETGRRGGEGLSHCGLDLPPSRVVQ